MTFDKANILAILSNPTGKTEGMNHRTFVIKAAIAMYNRQTEDEQHEGGTKHSNGIGFNGTDARYMTWFAQYAQKVSTVNDNHLLKAANKLKKYSGQLANIAAK